MKEVILNKNIKMKVAIVAFILFFPLQIFSSELLSGWFETGPYQCDNQIVTATWTNSGPPIKIKSTTLWMGANLGNKADIWANIVIPSRSALLSTVGWDHYANPTSLHQWTENFSPDWVTLGTGESLQIKTACNGFVSKAHQAHISVLFKYTLE